MRINDYSHVGHHWNAVWHPLNKYLRAHEDVERTVVTRTSFTSTMNNIDIILESIRHALRQKLS